MNEKRIEPRLLCSSLVKLTCRDDCREQEGQIVNLEDISPSGACISSDTSIPLHAPVLIEYAGGQLPGIVRYSMYYSGRYSIGIEFSFGCKWAAEFFQPEHLTDIQRLGSNYGQGGNG